MTETPPLYARYGKVGQQAELPITGDRTKRILHGAISTGDVALAITHDWNAETHQAFLRLVRLLPRATPELNAVDQLWKHGKRDALANRRTRTIDGSADRACAHILDMGRRERLRKAGVLSGHFWLAKRSRHQRTFAYLLS